MSNHQSLRALTSLLGLSGAGLKPRAAAYGQNNLLYLEPELCKLKVCVAFYTLETCFANEQKPQSKLNLSET